MFLMGLPMTELASLSNVSFSVVDKLVFQKTTYRRVVVFFGTTVFTKKVCTIDPYRFTDYNLFNR